VALENNKIILIYGFHKDEENTLDNLLKKNKLPSYRVMEKSMAKMKVKDILNGLNLGIYNSNLPDEKVVLLNNFSDEEVQTMLASIKGKFSPSPILAVVTETSIDWTLEYLIEHLLEEREWYKNRSK
jgi:acylphosphatase